MIVYRLIIDWFPLLYSISHTSILSVNKPINSMWFPPGRRAASPPKAVIFLVSLPLFLCTLLISHTLSPLFLCLSLADWPAKACDRRISDLFSFNFSDFIKIFVENSEKREKIFNFLLKKRKKNWAVFTCLHKKLEIQIFSNVKIP